MVPQSQHQHIPQQIMGTGILMVVRLLTITLHHLPILQLLLVLQLLPHPHNLTHLAVFTTSKPRNHIPQQLKHHYHTRLPLKHHIHQHLKHKYHMHPHRKYQFHIHLRHQHLRHKYHIHPHQFHTLPDIIYTYIFGTSIVYTISNTCIIYISNFIFINFSISSNIYFNISSNTSFIQFNNIF